MALYQNCGNALANGAGVCDGFGGNVVGLTAKTNSFTKTNDYAEGRTTDFDSDILASGMIFEFLMHLKITNNTKIL